MARLKVIWTSSALSEFENIWEYYFLRNQSPAYSIRIRNKTEQTILRIQTHPKLGRLLEDNVTRTIAVEKFQVHYQVYPTYIAIVSFWDPKQDPEKRWDNR